MKQINIFAFDPELADWTAAPWDSGQYCEVMAIVPDHITGPMERGRLKISSRSWMDQQHEWSFFVSAIAGAIPRDERSPGDVNGWGQAIDLMREKRESQEPVKMRIPERDMERFFLTEIVSY
jgi:hypothetical protein